VMIALAATIKPWRNKTRAVLALALGGVLSFASWGFLGDYLFLQGYAIAPFFFLATITGGRRVQSSLQRFSVLALSLLVVALGALFAVLFSSFHVTPPTVTTDPRTLTSILLGFVTSSVGVVLILLVSELISRFNKLALVPLIGERSLAIFLGHIIFAATTRIVLSKLGVTNIWLQLAIGTSIGIAAPLTLHHFAERLRLSWLFAAPKWLQPKPRAYKAVAEQR
jgi:fucose 4-O-acetylase-like acetyltransferase